MNRQRIWLLQLPLVFAWTMAFLVVEWHDAGTLESPRLRRRVYPALRTLAGLATDAKFHLRGPRPPRQKIVIVEIDDRAIAQLGRWPWHRDAVALVVDQIFTAGARVVGLDIMFAEPDTRVPDELADFLRAHALGEEIPKHESDLYLERVIAQRRDHLVLGWTSDDYCRPGFPEDGPCPVRDPARRTPVSDDFEKFAYDTLTAADFAPSRTRLVAIPKLVGNLDRYNAAAAHSGYLIGWADGDDVVRRGDLAVIVNGRPHPSLALAMARVGLDERLELELDPLGLVGAVRLQRSQRPLPVSPTGAIGINFRGGGYHFPYVSTVDLLSDDDTIQFLRDGAIGKASRKQLFDDAYVLLAVTAIGANDLRNFPFGTSIPGVEGHATILDNLLSGDTLGRPPAGTRAALLLVMTLGALLFAFVFGRVEALPAILLFVGTLAALAAIDAGYLFARHNLDLNTAFLFGELISISVFTLAAKYAVEERSKKFIRGAFSKYVAPAIVDSMLKDPARLKVGGEKKQLTILFSDIRGFSSFSEKMDAPVLAAFLSDYLGRMTDLVFAHGGTLDKYIGDAVMAFWGAPLDEPAHAARACRAAVQMIEVLAANRARYQAEYGIHVDVGIGLHSGAVAVGNMGSATIFEYTVIGDDVNLASRLEGITKYYRCRIITTRATLDAVAASGDPPPPHRVLDAVKVKGKKNAVEIIQLLEHPRDAEGLQKFAAARQLYLRREWGAAGELFAAAAALLATPDDGADGPSTMYVERCAELAANPLPADWDGTWEMHSK